MDTERPPLALFIIGIRQRANKAKEILLVRDSQESLWSIPGEAHRALFAGIPDCAIVRHLLSAYFAAIEVTKTEELDPSVWKEAAHVAFFTLN